MTKLKKMYLNDFEKHVKTETLDFKTNEQYLTIYTDNDTYPKVKLYYKDLLRAVTNKIDYLDSKKSVIK
jgi:hypothetical protein